MELNGVKIDDTYAEAFTMWCSRVLITAIDETWVKNAVSTFTGFAVSTIACDCEAGIDQFVQKSETPDGRPGVAAMLFASRKQLGNALMNRMGQCLLTCPTISVFDWLKAEPDLYKKKKKDGTKEKVPAIFRTGFQLSYFGDGFQKKDELAGRTIWKIPVMEGEAIFEDGFKAKKAIGGGNFFIFGDTQANTLKAAMDAVEAIAKVDGVITSFPGGICRSGSKTGSLKYKFLNASTNHLECPTLKDQVEGSKVPADVNCVLEIVLDGISVDAVKQAMADGIRAAVKVPGIKKISAGNYGGTLGKHNIYLKEILGL
ncbi:MAG: formylmethanofuran--tetrahydromethanopterin N-formyltransferase [Candidatus Helarchaeales archaeon]